MPKQMTFASLAHVTKKKVTRREKFLTEMETVVPWSRLMALIKPHYPKMGSKGGRPVMPLTVMLRIYCLQQWYALSDPMAEESLYDSDAMRRFAGLEPGDDRIPRSAVRAREVSAGSLLSDASRSSFSQVTSFRLTIVPNISSI